MRRLVTSVAITLIAFSLAAQPRPPLTRALADALYAKLAGGSTVAGTTTFNNVTVNGTCTGCGGAGTVTNVGNGTIGSLFAASWATATTTPALSLNFNTQSANCILAGPTSGGNAVPTCRPMVAADLGSFALNASFNTITTQPATDVITSTFRRNGAAQTANITEWQTEGNVLLAGVDKAGVASFLALKANGTAGAGFVEFPAQSSPPAAPASGLRKFADSTGRMSWIRASDGFIRTWDATLTANRVYTLPDAATSIPVIPQTITVTGPTAARTWTVPDASFTVARTDAANTFTGHQTIEGVTSTGATGTGNFVFGTGPAVTGLTTDTLQASANVGVGLAPSGTTGAWITVGSAANQADKIQTTNTNNSGTAATAAFFASADTASLTMQANGTARTTSRWGQAIGGYAEIVAATGNGLGIGTANSAPVYIGTNGTRSIAIGTDQGVTLSGASLQSTATKTLTESSATAFVAITVANSSACSGYVDYAVFAADATNTQAKSGQLFFSTVANSSGTVTKATINDTNTLNPVSSGTLTNTMTDTTGANTYTLLANAVSSLTQTTLNIKYLVRITSGNCTVTAQ